MLEETKAILKDLQDDLKRIECSNTNIEVVFNLDKLVNNIKDAQKQIHELIDEKIKGMYNANLN